MYMHVKKKRFDRQFSYESSINFQRIYHQHNYSVIIHQKQGGWIAKDIYD